MQIPERFSFIKWLKDETVALVSDDQGRKIVIKECSHAQLIRKFSNTVLESTRVLRTIMPELFAEGDLLYHSYVVGEMSGDTTGLFGFTQKALSSVDPVKLAGAINEMQYLSSASYLTTSNLEIRKSSWFIKNLQEAASAVTAEFDSYYLESVEHFLAKWGRTIDENSKTIVNGDLHPGNIFINCLIFGEARDFAITDWDILHFNNPGYDLADLYVWAWRDKVWREELINSYKSMWQGDPEQLNVFIKYNQVYLSAQLIKHVYLMRETDISEDAKVNANGLLVSSKELLKSII